MNIFRILTVSGVGRHCPTESVDSKLSRGLSPVRPIGKTIKFPIWKEPPLFNVLSKNQRGCCERQSFARIENRDKAYSKLPIHWAIASLQVMIEYL